MNQPFSHLLAALAEGDAHEELTEAKAALVTELQRESCAQNRKVKGKLTFELSMSCEPSGVVALDYVVRLKKPDPKRPNTILWATPGGNLSGENPRQLRLGELKEAPQPAHNLRDAAPSTDEKAKEA